MEDREFCITNKSALIGMTLEDVARTFYNQGFDDGRRLALQEVHDFVSGLPDEEDSEDPY